MATRVQTSLALGVTAAVLAVAGCGGNEKSFTIKVRDAGDFAYLVVDTAAPHRATGQLLLKNIGYGDALAFVTPVKPTVALDCSAHTQVGAIGITPADLNPYVNDPVSINVYGTGHLADSVCAGLAPVDGGG